MRTPIPAIIAALWLSTAAFASRLTEPDLAANRPVPQTSHGIELPVWGEDEMRENFDIRIWPDGVIFWLEQEHLRDMIADPSTPEAERESLQQVLDQQLALQQW